MKKWVKRHTKVVLTVVGLMFVGNGVVGLFITTNELVKVLHTLGIAVWLPIIFWASGAVRKLHDWWEKE